MYKTDPTLTFPSFRHLVRLLWRGLCLRCPNCGSRGLRRSFFHLRHECPTCGIELTRGEEDYYLGGMMFNIIMAETIFAVGFCIALYLTWPAVPWDRIEWILAAGMIACPILLYPISQTIWLAFDLAFRPPLDEEIPNQEFRPPKI